MKWISGLLLFLLTVVSWSLAVAALAIQSVLLAFGLAWAFAVLLVVTAAALLWACVQPLFAKAPPVRLEEPTPGASKPVGPATASEPLHLPPATPEPLRLTPSHTEPLDTPTPPPPAGTRSVDQKRKETRASQARLRDFLAESNEPRTSPGRANGGLDEGHAALLRTLGTSEAWTVEELRELAADLDLRPDGALDTINECAFERYDERVIDPETLRVNPDLARRLLNG